MDTTAFVRSLPKAELHVHLEGCITPKQVVDMGARNGVVLFDSVEAAQAAYNASSLGGFLKTFAMASSVLLHADDFAELATSYFRDAAEEAVRHVELMFEPQAHTTRGIPIGTVLDGLAKARRNTSQIDHSTFLIAKFMREREEDEALHLLEGLEPYRQHFVAIGIDSAETGHPPRKFVRLFQEARARG